MAKFDEDPEKVREILGKSDNPLLVELNNVTNALNRERQMNSMRSQLVFAMYLDGVEAAVEDAKKGNPNAVNILQRFLSLINQAGEVLEAMTKPKLTVD